MIMSLSALALVTATSSVVTLEPPLQQAKQTADTQRYLIQFKHDISPAESPLISGEQRIYNLDGTTKRQIHKHNTIAAELSESALKQLQNDPNIAFIEVDPVRELARSGKTSYGVSMLQAPLVADTASSNQKICVIDTGYDANHEDLPNGANITGEILDATGGARELGDWFEDTYGHGTHVTGTLAALGNNIGLAGILPSGALNIHHVKVVDHKGYWRFYGSDVIAAINACESAGANVVNMSLAGWTASQIEQDALQQAYDNGMLLVAAGGNFGSTQYAYPASYDSVMSVGAIDKNKNAWMFTQQNDQIELVAPGVEVNSTLPNNRYGKWDGTSVATPHVSGVAALVWSHFPSCSASRIRQALTESALDLGESGRDDLYGNGLVQAKAAVDWLTENGCKLKNKPLEALEYEQIYGLDIPNAADFGINKIPYNVDNSATSFPRGISRIAYHLQTERNGVMEWVWVSFDAHTQNLLLIGIPAYGTNILWNEILKNLNVFSNSENIVVTENATGVIEFWPHNYYPYQSKNIEGASGSSFDYDDKPQITSPFGYGSMQIHNLAQNQTVFAYNRFNSTSRNSDVGIGNRKVNYSDWTYAYNAHEYSFKRIEVWVKPVQ